MFKTKCTLLALLCLPVMAATIPVVPAAAQVRQDQKTVKGKIVEAGTGEAVIAASVIQKGTSNGVVSDLDGNYEIKVPAGATLQISSVGYKTLEVQVGSQSELNVTLEIDALGLDESIVVGYGVQKKSDVTGAVLRVGEKELKSRPFQNALQAMQGKAAGVDITSNERPGESGSATIRGARSLTASNSPLYVVDGIPMITGGITNLNPSDIESIDVLKDASATAIYGSRGANGVIIVTTKSGKSGKVSVNYSYSATFEQLMENQPLMSASDYIDYRRWSYYYKDESKYPRADQPTKENDYEIFLGASDPYAWANIEKGWASGTWDGSKVETTDWTGMVTQMGVTQDHSLSVSGGTDKIKAYLSFGYLDNIGTQKGQGYDKYTAKANVDITPVKWFTMGGSLNAVYSVQEYGQNGNGGNAGSVAGSLYASARKEFPYAVPYDDQGNLIEYPGGDQVMNVVDEWTYSQDQRITARITGSLYSQLDFGKMWSPLEGLKYRLQFGPDINNVRQGIYNDARSLTRLGSDYAYLGKTYAFSYTLDNLIYYDKSFGKNNFGLTLLQTMTEYDYESMSMSAENLPLASAKWNALGNVSSLKSWSSGLTEQQLMSYMARINYNYDQKYMLTASCRWDGASQLAEGHKWAFFPSVALGWRMDKEDFMSDVDWLDMLKLRAGVGVSGNAAISAYATKGGLNTIYYDNLGSVVSASYPSSALANQDLSWEKTTQYNVGIDFGFLKNRINGVIDVYKSRTDDLLLSMTVPRVTGYSSTYSNVGVTSNRGFELTLNTVNVTAGDFEWRSTLNASWQKDKIESLVTKDDDINNGWFIGEQIGVIYGYQNDGLWLEEDAAEMAKFNANGHTFEVGETKIVDQNGDYKIDANNDRIIIGNTRPNWIVGFQNDFTWKNFSLSIFLYGRMHYMYSSGGEYMDGRGTMWQIDYYNENNKDAEYQHPFYTTGTHDGYYNCLGYKEGSFLKIRNISLGYTLPSSVLSKIKAQNIKIYAQLLNPGMVFSNIKKLDMDTQSSVWNRGATVGLNITF